MPLWDSCRRQRLLPREGFHSRVIARTLLCAPALQSVGPFPSSPGVIAEIKPAPSQLLSKHQNYHISTRPFSSLIHYISEKMGTNLKRGSNSCKFQSEIVLQVAVNGKKQTQLYESLTHNACLPCNEMLIHNQAKTIFSANKSLGIKITFDC